MALDEEDLAEVTGAVEEVGREVTRLLEFIQIAVVAWSAIAGIWLYKHW